MSVVRPRSGLLTTLIVSLLQCVKVDTLGTLCEENLDRAYNPFKQFYLNYHAKFLYSLFNIFILIHPHKLFSIQLGPGTASLACARLIVPFAPFIGEKYYLAIVQRGLRRVVKNGGAENDLLNDLGFNLCVAPWSPVVSWSRISE